MSEPIENCDVDLKPKKKEKKKNWVMCCKKDLPPPPTPKRVPKERPPTIVKCKPIEKPPKTPKVEPKPVCEKPAYYRSSYEQRAYLEREVVPILMQGMVALARDQPRDPISYLEKFWLEDKRKCDIPIPQNLL